MTLSIAEWQRVKGLFQYALDLAPGDRDGYLEREAPREPALREEVRAMLALHAESAAELDSGAAALLDADARAALSDAGVLPRRLGPYRLLSVLGHGGMGMVYLAERSDGGLAQRVAVKLIRGGGSDQELRIRFQREREILRLMQHPNIARLLDGSVGDDGMPWFAMEYIEGEPITRWCDERGLGSRQRLALLLQVTEALQYAHRNLIVHRDIKPSNILVTADGTVKLLDFGIAKLLDDSNGSDLTGSRAQLMTPEYAAPEQVLGQRVSTATDVYALGVLLYELLSGRLPYRENAAQRTLIVHAVVHEEPERLRQAISRRLTEPGERAVDLKEIAARRGLSPAQLKRSLVPELDQILALALAKTPDQRYTSITALAEDLRAFLDWRPLLSRSTPLPVRLRKFVVRHRLAVITAALVFLVSVAGVAATRWQASEARRQANTARAVRSLLTDLFVAADPTATGGHEPTVRELLDRGTARIHDDLRDTPLVKVALLSDLGAAYIGLGEYTRAAQLLDSATKLGATADADVDERFEILLRAARAHLLAAQFDAAERAIDQADVLGPATHRNDRGVTALGLARARLDQAHGNLDAAGRRIEALLPLLLKANLAQSVQRADVLHELGKVRLEQRRYRDAIGAFRSALQAHVEAGSGAMAVSDSQRGLARALFGDVQLDEAAVLLAQVIASEEQRLGPRHPRMLESRSMLGNLWRRMKRYDDAANLHRQLIVDASDSLGAEHPLVANAYSDLATLEFVRAHWPEAATAYRAAEAITRKAYGPQHVRTLAAAYSAVWCEIEQGRLQGQRGVLDQAITTLEAQHETVTLIGALMARGRWFEASADLTAAQADLSRAVTLSQQTYPGDDRQSAWSRMLWARVLLRGRQAERAEQELNRALTALGGNDVDGGPRVGATLLELARVRRALGADRIEVRALLLRSTDLLDRHVGADRPLAREARAELVAFDADEAIGPKALTR